MPALMDDTQCLLEYKMVDRKKKFKYPADLMGSCFIRFEVKIKQKKRAKNTKTPFLADAVGRWPISGFFLGKR